MDVVRTITFPVGEKQGRGKFQRQFSPSYLVSVKRVQLLSVRHRDAAADLEKDRHLESKGGYLYRLLSVVAHTSDPNSQKMRQGGPEVLGQSRESNCFGIGFQVCATGGGSCLVL